MRTRRLIAKLVAASTILAVVGSVSWLARVDWERGTHWPVPQQAPQSLGKQVVGALSGALSETVDATLSVNGASASAVVVAQADGSTR